MKIKIILNPDTETETVIQGDFPEMKTFLESSIQYMLKWISGESMSHYASELEEEIYTMLNNAYEEDFPF